MHDHIQPALSAYQQRLHYEIHGPDEPSFVPCHERSLKRKQQRVDVVEPMKKSKSHPLPQLPEGLLEQQRSLSEMRELSPTAPVVPKPHPPQGAPPQTTTRQISPLKKARLSPTPSGRVSALSSSQVAYDYVMTKYLPPLEKLTNPLEIIERLKKEPELGFLYLTPLDDANSEHYNPYNLRVVVHSKVILING